MFPLSVPSPREMVPNASKRRSWHDYARHAIYLVTLIRNQQAEPFSEFSGGIAPGSKTPELTLTSNGESLEDALEVIEKSFEGVSIPSSVILPDYAMFILRNVSPDEKTLQEVIFWIKQECNRRYLREVSMCCEPTPGGEQLSSMFAGGFDERIARRKSDVERFEHLIEVAPRHFIYLQNNPDFNRRFQIRTKDGRIFEGFGNPLLLDDPQISAVRVSSRYTPEELNEKKSDWFRTSLNGGVLVSPFVSGAELKVRRWALENGGRVIMLMHNGFGSIYTPNPYLVPALTSGRLLQIAPMTHDPDLLRPNRDLCLSMNETAETIANHNYL